MESIKELIECITLTSLVLMNIIGIALATKDKHKKDRWSMMLIHGGTMTVSIIRLIQLI